MTCSLTKHRNNFNFFVEVTDFAVRKGSACISEMLRPCVLFQLLTSIRASHIQTISFVYSLLHCGGVQECLFGSATLDMPTVHRMISVIKQSLYRPRRKSRALGGWGSQNFQKIGIRRWQGCQPYAPAAFTAQEIILVLIYATGWVHPRARVRPEGLSQWKIPVTTYRIETTTFRLVAKCLWRYINRYGDKVEKIIDRESRRTRREICPSIA